MIGHDEASKQADALAAAALASTVRQFRYELKRRYKEWQRAIADLESSEGEGCIELLGAVTPGMSAFGGGIDQEAWLPVVRVFQNGGQWSLHLDDMGRAAYRNFWGASSPVVVKL